MGSRGRREGREGAEELDTTERVQRGKGNAMQGKVDYLVKIFELNLRGQGGGSRGRGRHEGIGAWWGKLNTAGGRRGGRRDQGVCEGAVVAGLRGDA